MNKALFRNQNVDVIEEILLWITRNWLQNWVSGLNYYFFVEIVTFTLTGNELRKEIENSYISTVYDEVNCE